VSHLDQLKAVKECTFQVLPLQGADVGHQHRLALLLEVGVLVEGGSQLQGIGVALHVRGRHADLQGVQLLRVPQR